MRIGSSFAVAAVLSFAAAPALANPLLQTRFGGLRGDALYDGPFAVYWNPAGLARPGFAVGLHTTAVARQASYFRDAESNGVPPELRDANTGEATIATSGLIPAFSGRYGLELDDFDLGFGLGTYATYAGRAGWDRNLSAPEDAPGAVDGPQRWHTISTSFLVLSVSPGFGLRYRRYGLSVGAAPVLSFGSLSTVRARNVDRTEDLVDEDGHLKEGRAGFEGDDVLLHWIVGARWDVDDDLGFAVTWHQGPQLVFDGKSFLALGTAAETTEPSTVPAHLGDTFRVSARIRTTDWLTVRPTAEFGRWSTFERQDVRANDDDAVLVRVHRDFEDTLAAKLRVDFHLTETLDLMAGVEFETGATPEQTHEPGLAETDSFQFGGGAVWTMSEHLRLLGTLVYHRFFDRNVRTSVQEPTANGDYADQRQYLALDLEILL